MTGGADEDQIRPMAGRVDLPGRAVFLSELDDDYQGITGLDKAGLVRRIAGYYLLAPSIIVHPAYIWQSSISHSILGDVGRELLRPPFTQLELGMYDSIESYMEHRISELRKPGTKTPELRSYESHGVNQIFEEARDLSIRFNLASVRPVSSSRRDQKFRTIVHNDLITASLDQPSLGSRIGAIEFGPEGMFQSPLGDHLERFVTSAELVSVDTVLRELYAQGYPDLAESSELRKRLLDLYYRTYADPDIIIPGTQKLRPGTVVNPYDVDFFWAVFSELFGEQSLLLAAPSEVGLLRALRDIRESSDWASFRRSYFETLETVDLTLRSQTETVMTAAQRLAPGKSQIYVLRRLWDKAKLSVAGTLFSGLALVPGIATGNPIAVGTGVGVAGLAVSSATLMRSIRRYVVQYNSLDSVRVQRTVREHVDRAVKASIGNQREDE